MSTFSIPEGDSKYTKVNEYFRGVDLNNSPSNVDFSRSPNAPNMIRDQVGKVRKRMGYTTIATAPNGGRINGVYELDGKWLVHAGTALYLWAPGTSTEWTELTADMADAFSGAFRFDEKLYILDGAHFRVYDGTNLALVSTEAYVPTVIISRAPSGGGTAYEALNMIGTKWTETFLGKESDTVYQLTTTDLDSTPVTAQVLNASGDWVEKTEGTDFTVNRAAGTVTFTTAPGVTPVAGQDNVKITASKDRGTLANIEECTVHTVYGVGGAADRVFLSGNPEKPGFDWYSGFENPAFWPDTGYTKVSRDGRKVVGYVILGNTLATCMDGDEGERNVVVRQGSLDDKGEALFKITNTLIGECAAAPRSFAYMGKEPVFLTTAGVYAITAEELTGEKYAQERSFFIRSALRDAVGVADAFGVVYRDFYVLSVGGDIYLLDGQQKTYEKNNPYSSYQYEAYFWPGINARCLWVEGEALCFGKADGTICRFAVNVNDLESYNDDGMAIEAYWETSDFSGKVMFKNKTITSISVLLAAAALTGVKVDVQKKGIWSQIYDAKEKARYFDWGYIDFSKFVFSADRTPHTLNKKVKIKKVDKVRFRLKNREKNEPFGIYSFGLEWKEPGSNYKG
ncbi:hypothetical protein [uncultured Oscillibacter sp.]|uniref:hypothetical protein n=1 Tax=uncultured Oscillibacter sp. TaxID=876091 RepID=UPI0025CEBCEE|nr:hypothetical protein [uncultured Oscillibacter sp.]